MSLLELCHSKDVILPLSTGPEKDYLLIDLVRSFGRRHPTKRIIFYGQIYSSTNLFSNLLKLHTYYVPSKACDVSHIELDNKQIIIILPRSQNVADIIKDVKDSVSLLIMTDLHKIYDKPLSEAVSLLEAVREHSPDFRFVGFTIPLQTSDLSFNIEDSRAITSTMCTTFGVMIDNSAEANLRHKYVNLKALNIVQYPQFQNRYEELKANTGVEIDWNRYLCSMKHILDVQASLVEECSDNDWSEIEFSKKKFPGIPLLKPMKFFQVFSSVLEIYASFGEICAFKAIDFYEEELFQYTEMFEKLPKLRNYLRFLLKVQSSLRVFRSSILLYLPSEITKKLRNGKQLSLEEFLLLSSSSLNAFLEQLSVELQNPKSKKKIIVHTELSTSAKVLSSWMTDLMKIMDKNDCENPPRSLNCFYYLSSKKEKVVKSKFVNDLFFYRNREQSLNGFLESSSSMGINVLFTNSSSIAKSNGKRVLCDLLFSFYSNENLLEFIQLKQFLRDSNSSFVILAGDKCRKVPCLEFWNDILDREAFYFNTEIWTEISSSFKGKSLAVKAAKSLAAITDNCQTSSESQESQNFKESDKSNYLYRVFKKQYPDFDGSFPKPKEPFKASFIYEIVFENADKQSDVEKMQTLCLIVPEELPKLCDFELVHQYHCYRISFRKLNIRLDLTVQQVQTLFKFNSYAYKNILSILDCQYDLEGKAAGKLLVAPIDIKNKALNWNLMNDCMDKEFKDVDKSSFNPKLFQDSIVCSELKTEPIYYVAEIDYEKSPRTELQSEIVPTYGHFYKHNYGLIVENYSQPLLKVLRLLPELNLKQRKTENPLWIVPEFYRVRTLPFSLWLKITALPAVLSNLFAQVNICKFNAKILNTLSTTLACDSGDFDVLMGLHSKTVDDQMASIADLIRDWDILSTIDFVDTNYGTEAMKKDRNKDTIIDDNVQELSSELDNEDVNLANEIDVKAEAKELAKGNYIYEQAVNDVTYLGYKQISAIIDSIKLELLYPLEDIEAMILASHECKLEVTLAQHNLVRSYKEIIRKVRLDEVNDLNKIVEKISDKNKDPDFFDYNDMEQISVRKETVKINEIFQMIIEYHCKHLMDDEEVEDSYLGANAREMYSDFDCRDAELVPPAEIEGFNKFFFQNSSSTKPPKLKNLLYVSSLAFIPEFESLKAYAFLGKAFIRYVLTNAILNSFDDKSTTETLNILGDECLFEAMSAEVARNTGFGELVGVSFEPKFWCPPFFSRPKQVIEKNGFSLDGITEHLIPEQILSESVQAFVGLYFHESGPKVAFEVMKALNFPYMQKLDLKKWKTYQWKHSFSKKIFKIEDSELLAKIDEDYRIDELQKILDYRFQNRDLLLHSLIHESFGVDKMRVLSTIGKNILDFIVSNCGFRYGIDSVLANDYYLVSSNAYAENALVVGLNYYLAYDSYEIYEGIHYLLREFHNTDQTLVTKFMFLENQIENKELTEIPSILIEAFQALFGAIYIDSEFNLQTVYKAFYPFLQKKLVALQNGESPNPCQELDEIYGHLTVVADPVMDSNRDIVVQYDVYRGGRVDGRSRNERLARELGAKKILRYKLHTGDTDPRLQDQGYLVQEQ